MLEFTKVVPCTCAAGALLASVLVASYPASPRQALGWHLIFADEFDGKANTPPDPAKWKYDLGDGSPRNPGWGNYEMQKYTNSTANIFQDGEGHLLIRALKEKGGYTSGRITTEDLFEFTYGKVEARIQIPFDQGLWPAFWMLGSSYKAVAWPICGEVDIMENFGARNRDGGVNHGTLHGPGYASTGITGLYKLPEGQKFSDAFHLFAAAWSPDKIEFFVDGNPYLKVTPASMRAGSSWVFNGSPFFLVLNLAVGGYPAPVGYPDESVRFPQQMVVDYVRVYQRDEDPR
jgi:beta-glucanase (GH16 family)